jgi:hypothetical protein
MVFCKRLAGTFLECVANVSTAGTQRDGVLAGLRQKFFRQNPCTYIIKRSVNGYLVSNSTPQQCAANYIGIDSFDRKKTIKMQIWGLSKSPSDTASPQIWEDYCTINNNDDTDFFDKIDNDFYGGVIQLLPEVEEQHNAPFRQLLRHIFEMYGIAVKEL